MVPICTIAYAPKGILFLLMSGMFLPITMVVGLILDEIHLDVGNAFSHEVMVSTNDMVIDLVYCLYGSEWHVLRALSFMVLIDHSMIGICLSLAHMCKLVGEMDVLNLFMLNLLSPCTSVIIKPLSSYSFFTISKPFMICFVDLLTSACVVMKFIFPLLVWKNGVSFT